MKPLGSQVIAEFIHCSRDILDDRAGLERLLGKAIKKSGLTLITTSAHKFEPVGVTVIALIGESHVVIHTYPEARHASIDIFTCSNGAHAMKALLKYLKKKLEPETIRVVNVNRGNPLEVREEDWITSFSSNGYETRYHIKKHIHSERSAYQQIDIIENDNFGRMMFLDRDLQIAERDAHIYNRAMVSPLLADGRKPGRVVILGGGDGGVLSELLKKGPESVVLVDIDEAVIKASKKHMESVCGASFSDSRVEVVIADAFAYLENVSGIDSVIYDLTMYPEALTLNDREHFLKGIFGSIRRCLTPGGMVTMQCCSEFDKRTRLLLTGILSQQFNDIEFDKVLVPSFCENWIFAVAHVSQPAAMLTDAESEIHIP
jgi:S-adenosylmethionine decarboxylase proenzyme